MSNKCHLFKVATVNTTVFFISYEDLGGYPKRLQSTQEPSTSIKYSYGLVSEKNPMLADH